MKTRAVHQLVAEAFIGRRPSQHETNHKDGNKANNCAANLEWCTSGQNQRHAYASGLHRPMPGENNPRAKLTLAKVYKLRSEATRLTRAQLAEKFGVSVSTVDSVLSARTWGTYVSGRVSPKLPPQHGADNPNARITEATAYAILRLASKLTPKQLASRFRIRVGLVHKIQTRRTWRHLTTENRP